MNRYTRKIVCLANSMKKGGNCIAGREVLDDGYSEWLRPVSGRASAELSLEEYRYATGGYCQLLDIADIPLLKAAPQGHQTENHIIDATCHWARAGRASWKDLAELIEDPVSLWLNGTHTQPGLNDCVTEDEMPAIDRSLVLIEPESLTVHVGMEFADTQSARQGVRANFTYGDDDYSLRITDPAVDSLFRSKGDGDYKVNDVYLCVSLTESFDDHRCHKHVAAILSEQSLK